MTTSRLKPARQSRLAGKIRRAIGASPNEDVVVQTPQFTRTNSMPDPGAPPEDFEALRSLTKTALREMGCLTWDAPDAAGNVLMLFPGEWYGAIPERTLISTISGAEKPFQRGVTDNDIRFGALAFGFRVKGA